MHYPPPAPAPAPARPSSALGIVALVLAIAGAVVFPILAVLTGMFMHGSSDSLTGIAVVLGFGGLSIIAATILAIVALARGQGGRVGAIVALVLGVLSVPAGIAAGFFGVLFASGGAHGRPLRVGAAARKTPTTGGDAWSEHGPEPDTAGIDPKLRPVLAEAWLTDAALEHASVAAFGALSLDLIALGAPPSLVRRSHEAALEEVDHARDCFALASAYAGAPLTAAPLPEARAAIPAETRGARLRRVAVESAVDGCIGEATAAAVAREASKRAADPVVAGVLARIARDERRHADLASDILDWCVLVGGPDVLAAVCAAVARDRDLLVKPEGLDLSAHGRASEAAWRTARIAARRALVDRLEAARGRSAA